MNEEELKNEYTERAKIFQQAMESCKSSNPMDCIEWFADRITELEKENAELKKNYEDSLVAYGVLKNKVDLLAQPSPLESMQDVLITTQKIANEKQKEQITKAKDHIKKLLDCLKQDTNDPQTNYYVVKYMTEAEQFWKGEK